VRIKFIGTGSGKSSLQRYHSSFLISSGRFNILVDAGDGISRALLKQNISYNSIDGILLTHLHADHFAGLPGLLAQMKMSKREAPLRIIMHQSLSSAIRNFIHQAYIFPAKLSFEIHFAEFNYNEYLQLHDDFGLIARQNHHLDDNLIYAEEKNVSVSSSSFLFKLAEKYLFYTSDIGDKEDLYLFKDYNINVIISEITHVKFEEIFMALKELKPGRLFFTHISEENEPDLIKLYNNLPDDLRSKIIPAVDGMLFEM
jgi:ribonuclease Z